MVSRISSFLLFFLFTRSMLLPSEAHGVQEIETHLHLYLHENFIGPCPTSISVVMPNNNLSSFGTIRVFANELREGPEPASKLIGQSQGTGTTASRDEGSSLVEANFVFTDGKYTGSTLAIFGRPVRLPSSTWEVSVIGGTGQFRLARGYALGKNLVVVPGKAIVVEFDLYFKHPCDRCCSFSSCVDSKAPSAAYCFQEQGSDLGDYMWGLGCK